MDEKIREQRSRFPRAALLRTALVSDARDVEMRPFESLREFAQERRRRDRAAFTAADVGEIRKITLQLLSVLFRDRQMPGAIFGAIEKGTGMASVAKRKTTGGREKSRDYCGREAAVAGERGELLVEQADEFFLIEAIYEAAHERAQIGGGGGYGLAVAGNVSEKQTADSARGATGNVVNVAATLGLAERFAVNPHVQPTQFDTAGSKLAAAPDLHALHVLRRRIHHANIITVERKLNRFNVFVRICTILRLAG